MKSLSVPGLAAIVAALLFTAPTSSQASDHWWSFHRHHHSSDGGRAYYFARPRSSFVICAGTGYAGRGYYYGPPACSYYYERPGVTFYRTLAVVPSSYRCNVEPHYHSGGLSSSVQSALARRGYYYGPIDGDIGPGSRRAIARYQADHGLRPTGEVSYSLLRSLGIQ